MRVFTGHRIAVVLAILALGAIVFLNGLGTFHTDIKPEIYIRPWDMLGHYLSSWTSSPYLGSPNFNVGLMPVLAVLSALRGIGLSPEFAFKLFHFVLWLFAAWGANRLSRQLVPSIGRWGGLLVAFLYLANPYTITAGATLAIALPMAVLPWQLLCLVQGLRRPNSWAWPALFGLTFFLMSGMNVAVVPLFGLLAVIPVALAMRVEAGVSLRDAARVLRRSALFVILVSVYWLVPAVTATATGAQIVEGSESMDGIAKVSSLVEVLRGLGLWPLYGSSSVGPWVPEHAIYVVSPLVMLLTMLWPTLGLLALRWADTRARVFIAASVFMAAIIMVGIFPNEESPASPFGVLLREFFQIPVLSAFRTTNKIGAVLTLALAMGVAIALLRLVPRAWRFVPARFSVTVVLITMFAVWTLPAISGRLYISPVEIPDYWEEAAQSLDESDQPGTVLVLPGQVRPNYRWTDDRPDDILNSVLNRRAVLPETTPNASAPAVNFLAALDGSFQSDTSSDQVVSAMARYLGAGQVLLRHDVVWEDRGGARPAQTSRQIGADPGLFGRENFGSPGQNTLSPAMEDPYFFGEQFLPPLQVYDVVRSSTPVRAMPLRSSVLVAGDGFAFPQMADAGLLDRTPLIRYAQDIEKAQFPVALANADRLVLSDTNARRNVIDTRLTVGQGPLLTAQEELASTRTLGDDPEDQTVRVNRGMSVSTTTAGGTFFDLPFGAGEFAFDGDLSTGWRFGDFESALGQRITSRFDEPTEVGKVALAQLPIGDAQIDQVTVKAGSATEKVTLPESGVVNVDLGGVTAQSLTVTVDSVRGKGFNLVGMAEINVNGLRATPTARTPLTFNRQWEELDKSGRERFANTPLDILFTRVQNTPSTGDDSETHLDRTITLPDEREHRVRARVRVDGPVETLYDRVEGRGNSIRATSSGHYFDDPALRASSAADGNTKTAWIPGNGTRNAWWQIDGRKRSISGVTITQERQELPKSTEQHRVSRVSVEVDGKEVTTSELELGENRIDFAEPVQGSTVRVTLTGVTGDPSAVPPRFSSIDTGLEMKPKKSGRDRCLPVALVDGKGLGMRPITEKLAGRSEQGTWWESCGPLAWPSGEHRIVQNEGFILDTMSFSDTVEFPRPAAVQPTAKVLADTDSRKRISVVGANGPYAVVIGQSANPQWRAKVNGEDLGPAQTLNGFSSGWIIPDARAADIEMTFTPQRWANVALAVSGSALLGVLVIVLVAAWRRSLLRIAETESSTSARRRPPWATRMVLEGAFILGAGFFGGVAGLLGSVAWVALMRLRPVTGERSIVIGAALVGSSVLAYLVVLVVEGNIGTVSADAVSASMIPHGLAMIGLVWAVAGAAWKVKNEPR